MMNENKFNPTLLARSQTSRILKRMWSQTPRLWSFRKTTSSKLQEYYHYTQYDKKIEHTRDQFLKKGFGQDIF